MIRRKTIEESELNLAPLIDIFANMLFFLMTTVSFLTLKTLNASVPAMAKPGEKVDTLDQVNVSVEVLAEGYVLKASGQPDDKSARRLELSKTIPRRSSGQLDAKELTDELWEVKKVASSQKTVMIFPGDGIAFQDVVVTMDATRDMPSLVDPKKRVLLFPRPVLSELVK
jgi:biopolymer transport protein ExbD